MRWWALKNNALKWSILGPNWDGSEASIPTSSRKLSKIDFAIFCKYSERSRVHRDLGPGSPEGEVGGDGYNCSRPCDLRDGKVSLICFCVTLGGLF